MNIKVIVAVILIALGVLGLVYKGFNYTSQEKVVDSEILKVSVPVEKSFDVPVWASVGVLALGVVVLLVSKR